MRSEWRDSDLFEDKNVGTMSIDKYPINVYELK